MQWAKKVEESITYVLFHVRRIHFKWNSFYKNNNFIFFKITVLQEKKGNLETIYQISLEKFINFTSTNFQWENQQKYPRLQSTRNQRHLKNFNGNCRI